MEELKPWITLSSEELLTRPPRLRVLAEKVQLPDGRIVDNFYQIELPEYVVIFARTPDGSIVMERHYKHGPRRVILALPAGYLEPGENPLAGARRELLEETGYEAKGWRLLGSYVVNGNQGCGKAHIILATGAHQTRSVQNDDLEEIQVLLLKPDEVVQALMNGDVATLGSAAAIAIALNAEIIQRTSDTDK